MEGKINTYHGGTEARRTAKAFCRRFARIDLFNHRGRRGTQRKCKEVSGMAKCIHHGGTENGKSLFAADMRGWAQIKNQIQGKTR